MNGIETINVLVVEDEPMINELIQAQIRRIGYNVVGIAFDAQEAYEQTQKLKPDIIMMDVQMTDPETGAADSRAGLEATRRIMDDFPRPIILLTAYESPELLQDASQAGVSAYLLKPVRDNELSRAIAVSLARFQDAQVLRHLNVKLLHANQLLESEINERKRIELELRRQAIIFENITDAIILTDLDSIIIDWNPAAERMFGYRREEVLGKNPAILHGEHTDLQDKIITRISNNQFWRSEERLIKQDGDPITCEVIIVPLLDLEGKVIGTIGLNHDVTEYRQLVESERQEKLMAEALIDTAAVITSTLNLDEVLDRILINIDKVAPHDAANIIIVDEGEAKIVRSRCHHKQGLLDKIVDYKQLLKEFPLTAAEKHANKPIIIEKSARSRERNKYIADEWIQSMVCSPVTIKNDILAFLLLYSAQPDFFTRQHAERLQALADQAAIAFENARLYNTAKYELGIRMKAEEAERQERILAEALRDTAAALSSTLKLEEVLDRILSNLNLVIPHEAAAVMMVDGGIGTFARYWGYAEHGLSNRLNDLRFPILDIPVYYAIVTTRKTILTKNIKQSEDWVYYPGFEWIASNVTAPIISRGEVIGFLLLDSSIPDFFSETHVQHLETFAVQASIAIDNARLYEKVEQLANTDILTGLYNRNFFEIEMDRMQKSRLFPISLLITDLDGLKLTNDTYGHAAGDNLLRRAAEALRGAFRPEDIIARIGGDEFAVILPGVSASTLLEAKRRVQKRIAENNEQFKDFVLSMSIGIATADPGASLQEVLREADQVMYLEKQMKRNNHQQEQEPPL